MKQTSALLLAAGLGTRLKPLTNHWPKCLMPINFRPLLEYWFSNMKEIGVDSILVNTHYLSENVHDFIYNSKYKDRVTVTYEEKLLGTAGTIRKNSDFFNGNDLLLAHADNWSCCNYSDFLNYHYKFRPKGTLITMMTFESETPSSCGIVELNEKGIVVGFHEKVDNPPGNLANAAVYLLDSSVVEWIQKKTNVKDFSTEVLPNFIGKIATWKNEEIHRDIGTIEMLTKAQTDNCNWIELDEINSWQENFIKHQVHKEINEYSEKNS